MREALRDLQLAGLSGRVVLDANLVGGWRHTIAKKEAVVEARMLRVSKEARAAIEETAQAFGRFLASRAPRGHSLTLRARCSCLASCNA